MPGPSSSTGSTPSARRTVTVPPGGLHLAALSSRLVTARSRAVASPTHPPGLGAHVEGQAAARGGGPARRPGRRSSASSTASRRERHRVVAGQLDEVADQRGHLLDLGADVVQQLGARPRAASRRRAVGLGEQVEVGAQRGQRGAQLVAGVGDQLALPVARRGERGEHRVERRGQPGDLVVALDRDRVQPLGAGDVLGRGGEPAHRAQAVAGDAPAGQRGGDHAGEAEEAGRPGRAGRASGRWAPATGRARGRCRGRRRARPPSGSAGRRPRWCVRSTATCRSPRRTRPRSTCISLVRSAL